MTQPPPSRFRQLVDWRAAVIGALAGAVTFLLVIAVVLPFTTGGSLWSFFRYLASILLGDGILPPPAGFDLGAVIAGLLVHLILSLLYGAILAVVIHRWGLVVGLVGGALFGIAIYAINIFTFTLLFEWFYLLRSWPILLAHVLFGAVAGFVYELLEVERYAPVEP